MRGFVFTLKPVRRKAQRNFIRGFSDVSSVVRRYGTVIYFTFVFAVFFNLHVHRGDFGNEPEFIGNRIRKAVSSSVAFTGSVFNNTVFANLYNRHYQPYR